MLSFNDVALRRGERLLFRNVTFTVHAGQKVGVTGANGAGKSSLLALIRGELQTDAGSVSLPAGLVTAHVAQETRAVDTPAIDYVMRGDTELHAVRTGLEQAEHSGDGTRQAALHARLEEIGGYAARSRAARLLHGLGFTAEQQQFPVRAFSGGWRMRLNLAQTLMCRSDLLLLDEPTNHLDLDAVIWLQDWLRAYRGTLLLISHDREFLDQVLDHILHLERQTALLYAGNYSVFERRRTEALARQHATHAKQQREVAHIQHYVDRFRAKATKARQAQSRLKALQRMRLIAPAHVDSPFHFSFPAPEKLPNPLLRLEHISAGYGETTVLSDLALTLTPGDRVGLLGANGAGKSTLIKLVAGALQPLAGRREPAPNLRIGYFAQHQLEQLRAQESPLSHLQRLDRGAGEQALRDFLGGFAFSGDRVLAPTASFSGGEKARLVLALLVFQRPNLLLLDEPTNHLDLEMRDALGLALQDFEGAMVLVSHDRHLIRSVADSLWLVAGGNLAPFDGDLDDYSKSLMEQRNGAAKQNRANSRDTGTRKDQRRERAEQRQRLHPLRQELQQLEKSIERLNTKKAALERELADPRMYEEPEKERLKQLLLEQGRVNHDLGEAETTWMTLCERLEGAEREA